MGTGAVDAWVLREGDGKSDAPAELVREMYELGPMADDDVLAEPLYGCWEGNMNHALERKPIDICRMRGEPRVVLGNAGVVRVVRVGPAVKTVRPGQKAMIFCNGEEDWFGYPRKILAYDAPNTMGCLAKQMKLTQKQLVPLPEGTRYSLAQWAAFSLRFITAWSNWELAYGTYRLSVSADELAAINVWGWGGGTTLAEIDLARRLGHRCVMLSGTPKHLDEIRAAGVFALDRTSFGELQYDPDRYKSDTDYRAAYQEAEGKFIKYVEERTSGRMVHIFVDYVGTPVFRATLKALARGGVVATAGWREGMNLSVVRAVECISRHQLVHTHYARYQQAWKAIAFAEASGWLPHVDAEVTSFDDIPALAARFRAGEASVYPIFAINPE